APLTAARLSTPAPLPSLRRKPVPLRSRFAMTATRRLSMPCRSLPSPARHGSCRTPSWTPAAPGSHPREPPTWRASCRPRQTPTHPFCERGRKTMTFPFAGRAVVTALVLAAALATASVADAAVLHRGNGSEPQTLDPAHAATASETAILQDL